MLPRAAEILLPFESIPRLPFQSQHWPCRSRHDFACADTHQNTARALKPACHCEPKCFKSGLVVTHASYAITFTSDRHLCKLQNRIVGGRKSAVGRQLINFRVFEIAFHYGAEIVKFFVAGFVEFYLLIFEQVFPGHSASPAQRGASRSARSV
jgi:hypothetical protein